MFSGRKLDKLLEGGAQAEKIRVQLVSDLKSTLLWLFDSLDIAFEKDPYSNIFLHISDTLKFKARGFNNENQIKDVVVW